MTHLTRRQLLAGLLAAAGATACGPVFEIKRDNPSESASDPASVGLDSTPSAERSEPTARPSDGSGAYEPLAQEGFPGAKRLAGRFVQALGTYGEADDPRDVVIAAAGRRHRTFDVREAVRRATPMFIPRAASTAEIVYPQLGGLDPHADPDRAAVMVVVRQTIDGPDGRTRVTRTVDVRLRVSGGEWTVAALKSTGGTAVPRPRDLPAPAVEVLDDVRIDLPDSARWDIHSGAIDERLLVVMRRMADLFPYSVTVLRSGHPRKVFGASSTSNHTVGRAVDIWAVDGTPVVQQHAGITYSESDVVRADRKRPAFRATQTMLRTADLSEIGSPWNLDPSGQPSFTDPVHQDHLHVAV